MTVHTGEEVGSLRSLVNKIDEHPSVLIAGERRNQSRHPMHTKCELRLFYGPGVRCCTVDGVVRNLAFGGVSAVSGLIKPIRAGRPVEVHVPFLDGPQTFLAGTIVFCRKVEDDCHEVGIALRASNCDAILSRDPDTAKGAYAWFAEALEA
ncbi:MAG: PilZ domain-containing protein [Phycisphaerae bacterium]|jgi:hypothetical protein